MKFLIINDFRSMGGTEVQSLRELNSLRKLGHKVSYLTFDPKLELCIGFNSDGLYNIPFQLTSQNKIRHRLLASSVISKHINEVMNLVDPDYVHLNNILHAPLDVYTAISSIPTIQTIRDYAAICPKSTCVHADGKQCRGYKFENCLTCVHFSPKYIVKWLTIKNMNKHRLRSVDVFVSPSQALADACTKNGIKTICLNNPFDFTILKNTNSYIAKKIYLYYGAISEDKGVKRFIEAFDRFYASHNDVKLFFAGRVIDDFKDYFQSVCKREYVTYLGLKKNSEIMELYKDIYCVVVPSLWIENYPNTVLEAIANKKIVLGTNRGGIPELIGKQEFLFDILDTDDMCKKLEYSYCLNKEEYEKFTSERYDFIWENNSIDKYINRLLGIFKIIEK